MTTLSELYTKVRNQTDTNASELPDALLNDYLHEAFNRTIAAENLWPFYEQVWDLVLPAGTNRIVLPGDVNEPGITGLWDFDNKFRLQLMDLEKALDYFNHSSTPVSAYGPTVYAMWTNEILLYPIKYNDEDKDYRLVGFRSPVEWSSLTPGDEPDCDERLHLPLAHYATALAYAREEDEVLEDKYMQRWQRDVEMARQAIMEANRQRPLTMGPHFITPIGASFAGSGFPRATIINTP